MAGGDKGERGKARRRWLHRFEEKRRLAGLQYKEKTRCNKSRSYWVYEERERIERAWEYSC